MKPDVVDYHYYKRADEFYEDVKHYDTIDRGGPKIFFGEYAAQSVAICSTKNRNNLECAISEAAYLTGLERNAEVVQMAQPGVSRHLAALREADFVVSRRQGAMTFYRARTQDVLLVGEVREQLGPARHGARVAIGQRALARAGANRAQARVRGALNRVRRRNSGRRI